MKAKAFKAHWLCSRCKVFGQFSPKTLHLPQERRSAPVEIRIVTMAEFHKNGSKEPFLWNCAAAAARINRKAVYSVDIIIPQSTRQVQFFPPCQPPGKLSLSFQALHLRNSYKSVTIVTTLQGKSQRRLHSCSVSAVLIAAPCCRCSAGISAWAAKIPAAAVKALSRKGQKALR